MIDPAWINAGTSIVSGLLKPPTSGPALSGGSNSLAQDFDFSGFTVATSSARATGAPNNKTTTTGAPATSGQGLDSGGSVSPLGQGLIPWLIVGGAALAAFLAWPR